MKKIFTTIGILFLFLNVTSFAVHKFYTGVYQVDYKLDKKEFQITSRVFIEDIEKAIETKYKKKLYLATSKESKEADAVLTAYFKDKLQFSVNTKKQKIVFLTKEYEEDVLICYHKIPFSGKIKSISIYNSILIELFSEQQNLLHININGNKKSFLFTNINLKEEFKF